MSAVAAVFSDGRSRELCDALDAAMAHRGPVVGRDDAPTLSMAVRGRAAQCFAARDGLAAMVDGEIHNRADLVDAGVEEGQGPAEVVLRCYERWGVDAPRRLVGDFAFVLHDAKQQVLLAARDALGMRPLYYHRREGVLLLATEAQALVASRVPSSRPNALAIALFLAQEFDEDGYTLREQIEALPPAHLIHVTPSGVEIRRYWEPDPWRKLEVSDDEAVAMFAATFREAVRCRMPKGPLGVILSGGLDSSAIAGQASALKNGGPPPLALHVSLPGWDSDETAFSGAVARKWGLPSVDIEGGGPEMTEAERPRMPHADMIYAAWGACFEALFEKARARGVGTVMTGLGADQWLDETGYECVDALSAGDVREVAAIIGLDRQPLSSWPYRLLWQDGVKELVPMRVRKASRRFRRRPRFAFLQDRWSAQIVDRVRANRDQRLDGRWPDRSSEAMCRRLEEYGVRVGVPMTNLRGALLGLEVEHPFLDRRVFELALSMPRRLRLRRGHYKNKPLLRGAVADLLPREVHARRDAAEFSCYLRHVYLRHGGEITTLFRDSRLAELGVVDVAGVKSTFDEGLPDSSIISFGLILSMELWLRQSWS